MNQTTIIISLLILIGQFVSPAKSFAQDGVESQPKNIIWLVIEDMSPTLALYGDDTVTTPNIDSLAKEGVVYTNVFSTSGVCAPSRAAIATGVYPTSMGANNMRTSSNTQETGLPKYEAVPPVNAKMLSQLMREAGYFTTNNYKTDYQFTAPDSAWNENGVYAHWRHRPSNQPFFSVFNFTTTHESGLFEPYGIRKIEQRHYYSDNAEKIANLPTEALVKTDKEHTPVHISKDTHFPVPPYLPDTPVVQHDLWKMYNNLVETDKQIGAILKLLKEDGLYDNTIIVFYSDHGGPLPRQKRLIYDSGLKVPMVIRFPDGEKAGTIDEQLISFVDFAPTALDMAGISQPDYMQGRSFISQGTPQREYIHAAADRFDAITDRIRAVRSKCYKYIRNYQPDTPYYLPVAYREKIPTMQELLSLEKASKLTPDQKQWFRTNKRVNELFDVCRDPHELSNLANIENYKPVLNQLEHEMDRWLVEINDDPLLPERELIKKLWKGSDVQPKTSAPVFKERNGKITITSNTPGAVISYRIRRDEGSVSGWRPYTQAIAVDQGEIEANAHRIGFQKSISNIFHINHSSHKDGTSQ